MSPIRVLVIDDSAYNRQTLVGMLESDPAIQVVGRAADGDEGLRQVQQLLPDLITLDLEMPRMDGFTFLRILMSRRPTPVLVVSGWGARENVFKALELGALDFVVKPERQISPELRSIRDELVAKVKLVTQLQRVPGSDQAMPPVRAPSSPSGAMPAVDPGTPGTSGTSGTSVGSAPPSVVAIGASTGGPPALQQIIAALPARLAAGILITQHMPPKFTRAFAERLQRSARMTVREAEDGDALVTGAVLVAPGSGSIVLERDGDRLRARIEPQEAGTRYVPSVDRMLETASAAMGPDLMAVILTGMGGDGQKGVKLVKARGGRVVAESAETAVIFGMPQEAIATGVVDEVLPLGKVADAIDRFCRRGQPA